MNNHTKRQYINVKSLNIVKQSRKTKRVRKPIMKNVTKFYLHPILVKNK